MDFEFPKQRNSIIKVIGVGGGGGNAVNHMFKMGIEGVDFVVCNTDAQDLTISPVPNKIQLGPSLTEGRGAGSQPEIGRNAAVENIDEIRDFLSKDAKMVFITAGMGGGTGTGAAPVIANVARELGILTVGIVTVPFNFEGRKRRIQAEEGLEAMRNSVDTLLVINNERLLEMTGKLSISEAFSQADDILATAARGITEVIEVTGAINVDFNDVNTVMKNGGVAIMGSATAEGENRAIEAVKRALESPLLNDNDINGAEYVLLNVTYGEQEVLMDEISEITDYIQEAAGSTADVIFGHAKDETLGNKIGVTIIATGFKSTPITGFEKAPVKSVSTLEVQQKEEVKAPMDSPTSSPLWSNAKEVTAQQDEPYSYIKKTEEPTKQTPSTSNFTKDEVKESKITFDLEPEAKAEPIQKPIEFEVSAEKEEIIFQVSQKATEDVKRYELNDDSESKLNINGGPAKSVLSPEESQRKTQERLSRIQEYTQKLKRVDGIQELENEPAFIRRNMAIDESKPSEANDLTRFSVKLDDDQTSLNSNNSFLHDNVD